CPGRSGARSAIHNEVSGKGTVICGRPLSCKGKVESGWGSVGCCHLSGLFARRNEPLALMQSAREVPLRVSSFMLRQSHGLSSSAVRFLILISSSAPSQSGAAEYCQVNLLRHSWVFHEPPEFTPPPCSRQIPS